MHQLIKLTQLFGTNTWFWTAAFEAKSSLLKTHTISREEPSTLPLYQGQIRDSSMLYNIYSEVMQ